MSTSLPPLTALRAFDAAARHMSFQNAAAELNVTPAALSFQIKSLEEHLGTSLFRRLNRAVELTEAGRALAPGAQDGFEALTVAWRAARRLTDVTSLTVTAGPAFTAKWMAPRLYDFARDHPEIDLRFSASLRLMDFDRDEVDVAIRFGYGPDPGLFAIPLADEWVTPVMGPDLAALYPTPASLRDAPLIFDNSIDFLRPPCDWPTWFRAAGVDFTPTHGVHFSQADHAVDAALSGAAVTLGRRTLVSKDLENGRLVAPYKVALSSKARFRILCPEGSENRPNIKAFRDWLIEQTAELACHDKKFDIVEAGDVASV